MGKRGGSLCRRSCSWIKISLERSIVPIYLITIIYNSDDNDDNTMIIIIVIK